jgi:ABC-type sugar transport system substrate-binding protein
MLAKPDLQPEKIVARVQDEYGLRISQVTFLPVGADVNTIVYRIITDDGTPYFFKFRKGVFDETSVALTKFLSDQGVAQIIPPLVTKTGQLWGNLDAFKTILYPFIEGRNGYEVSLSDRHWDDLGTALKKVHKAEVPPTLFRRIRRETYSPKGAIYATAATNSYAAAGVAADNMFAALKDKIAAATPEKPVVLVDFNQDATSQSVTDRGKGFRDQMIKLITTQTKLTKDNIRVQGNPAYIAADTPTAGKSVIIDVQVPASPKDTDATNTASAILNRVKSDNILGIFCSNEGTARAVLAATNDGSALTTQYAGLLVIGFDAGKAQKAAVRNKYFFGAITQDPYNIGYKAVELAVMAKQGQAVSDVDTGAKFYNAANMDQSDIAILLYD